MLIGENILLALNGLRANKMRSLLTMLGIIIGIASVIAIMTLGDSISSSVTDSMASMGANNITVGVSQKSTSQETTSSGMTFSMGPRFTKMTEDDYISDEMLDSLEKRYGDSIQGFSLTESVGSGTAQLGSLYAYVNATGVNEANLENTDLTLLAGRTLTERDQIEAKKYVWYPIIWLTTFLMEIIWLQWDRRWMCCSIAGIIPIPLSVSINTKNLIWDFPAVRRKTRRQFSICLCRQQKIRPIIPMATASLPF